MSGNHAKWQLVSEICDLSIPCSHQYPTHSAFIDWYLLLHVDESVGVDAIKQRYRKLALQLHPDKNTHPKAETAFKLVSQAYVCLTDAASREAFETDRRNHICPKCSIKSSEKPPRHGNVAEVAKTFPPPHKARPVSRSISQRVKELKARIMEEVAVINTCLKAKSTTYSTNQPQTFIRQNEIPIFNPSNSELQGCPHTINYRKLLNRFQERSTGKHVSSNTYPVFEPRSAREAYVHRFTTTSSKHMFYN